MMFANQPLDQVHRIERCVHTNEEIKSAVGAWCIAVVMTLIAAIALHEGVEKPVRRRMLARIFPPSRL